MLSHFSSRHGHTDAARLLLDSGIDSQELPLDRAAVNGKVEVPIDHGAKVNVADNNGWTPLHTASHGGHLDVMKLLLRYGADAEARNKTKQNAEDIAFENNKSEVAKFPSRV